MGKSRGGRTKLKESGWELSQELIEWTENEVPQLDWRREVKNFTDYWLSNGDTKADWNATWRVWARRAPNMGGALKSQQQMRLAALSRDYQGRGFRAPRPNEDAATYETLYQRWRDTELPQRDVVSLIARLKR